MLHEKGADAVDLDHTQLAGMPAPSRPMYDEEGMAMEQSPGGSRRRLARTREEDLPQWE